MSWRSASFGDVVAGVTVALTSLPQYIAYAGLAGVDPVMGVTVAGPPLIAFSFITRSPALCVGVTSITALMTHATLKGAEYKEEHGMEAWVDLLSAYAIMVGAASLLLGAIGAGKLAFYIPRPVQVGWKLGFALTVVASQMAPALFNAGASEAKKHCVVPSFISGGAVAMYRLGWMLLHPHYWSAVTFIFATCCYAFTLKGGKVLKKASGGRNVPPGLEVLLATVVAAILVLILEYEGDVVGPPPVPKTTGAASVDKLPLTGWVRLWPWELPYDKVVARLGGIPQAAFSAVSFAAIDFLAILSVQGQGEGWSPNIEMTGQGVACIVSGMAGGAPVGGSLSRSMVAKLAGVSSPLMGLVCGVVSLTLAMPSLATLLSPIPKAVLAAVVLAAVLPSVIHPKDLLKLTGAEFGVGLLTAVASAFMDPMSGFAVGLATHFLCRLVFGSKNAKDKAL